LLVRSRIGPYQITAKLGQGGMGEVWRAHDTRLKRDVALKILPQAFAADADRLVRFQREAQILASLSHPGIAAIYGVEEAGGTPVLVLELVEGPTLADQIAGGRIELEPALAIAKGIAEAVEAAHEAGVIHRDLKPSNVKVRTDGVVKVLDFGLAKTLDPIAGQPVEDPQTTIGDASRAGGFVGTPAYMSPEQLRGEVADRRADIWAFGCVLFEMLTGTRAFGGPTTSDRMAAVIMKDPDWQALPPDVPPAIRRLLIRCLKKNRKERLGHMDAVRLELEDALDPTVESSEPAGVRRERWWPRLGFAVLGIVLAASVAMILWPKSPVAAVARSTITSAEPLYISSATPDLAVSADGRQLVYVAGTNQLYVRAIDQLESRLILRGATGVPLNPILSPDGESAVFFDTSRGELMKISTRGGPAVALCRYQGLPRGATWAPDGVVFATSGPDVGLFRVPIQGGTAARLTTPDPGFEHWWPEIGPMGSVFFSVVSKVATDNQQIAVLASGSRVPKVLIPGTFPRYLPSTQHLIYNIGGTLKRVGFDSERFAVIGEPAPVLDRALAKSVGVVDFSVSGNGTLVYVPASANDSTQRTLAWVDRRGQEEIVTPRRPFFQIDLSPDGSRAAALAIEPTNHDIWIYDLIGRNSTRLTFDPASDTAPLWTLDGRRVVIASNRDGGHYNLFWKPADSPGPEERLTTSRLTQNPATWSPRGDLVFIEQSLDTGFDLMELPLTGARTPRVLLRTPFNETLPAFSRDGHWLAYQSDETGQYEIFVRPFPNLQSGQWQVSEGGGMEPFWSPDGREIVYRAGQSLMAVKVEKAPRFVAGRPTTLFQGPYLFGGPGRKYVPNWEKDRFLMIKAGALPTQIVMVLNWFRELQAPAPPP